MKTLYSNDKYRIIEIEDTYIDLEELKGDMYNSDLNPTIDKDTLSSEELAFEELVYNSGVYGYALEYWDSDVGQGWTQIDSCFGFIGEYTENKEHYIVEEFIEVVESILNVITSEVV